MDIWAIIGIGILGLIVIAILLKICAKFFTLNLILLVLAGIGIMIASFSMPEQKNGWNWDWILPQALLIFLYVEMFSASVAFDTEEYVSTSATEHWDGSVTVTSKLESRSAFWGVVGLGLGVTAFLVILNYIIFETHAIALGVVGAIATAYAGYYLISLLVKRHRRRKNYY